MKIILVIAILFYSFSASAQSTKQIDSLTFCFIKYKVPPGCSAESEFQVHCDHYSMTWLYMNNQMLQTMPEQIINSMAGQMRGFKKESITCYLLGNEAKGYKIRYDKEGGIGFQIVVYGVANGQPVLVQLTLDKEPKTNVDIPTFALQLVKLNN